MRRTWWQSADTALSSSAKTTNRLHVTSGYDRLIDWLIDRLADESVATVQFDWLFDWFHWCVWRVSRISGNYQLISPPPPRFSKYHKKWPWTIFSPNSNLNFEEKLDHFCTDLRFKKHSSTSKLFDACFFASPLFLKLNPSHNRWTSLLQAGWSAKLIMSLSSMAPPAGTFGLLWPRNHSPMNTRVCPWKICHGNVWNVIWNGLVFSYRHQTVNFDYWWRRVAAAATDAPATKLQRGMWGIPIKTEIYGPPWMGKNTRKIRNGSTGRGRTPSVAGREEKCSFPGQKLDQIGPNWTELDQIGLNWTELDWISSGFSSKKRRLACDTLPIDAHRCKKYARNLRRTGEKSKFQSCPRLWQKKIVSKKVCAHSQNRN